MDLKDWWFHWGRKKEQYKGFGEMGKYKRSFQFIICKAIKKYLSRSV